MKKKTTLRLPIAVVAELDRLADLLGMSRNELIRRALETKVKKAKAAKP